MFCKLQLQDIIIMQQCHITVITLSAFFAIYLTTLLVVCHILDHFKTESMINSKVKF